MMDSHSFKKIQQIYNFKAREEREIIFVCRVKQNEVFKEERGESTFKNSKTIGSDILTQQSKDYDNNSNSTAKRDSQKCCYKGRY